MGSHRMFRMNESILGIYKRLYRAYGPRHWWPADGPFEMMVGAILTQNTAWRNVERAIKNLKAASVLHPEGLRSLLESDLARLIYPSGYYNLKARRLKAFARYVGDTYQDDLDVMASREVTVLRNELLTVNGIGEETADDMLLYALNKSVFVVDAFTKRLFSRLEIANALGGYREYQDLFEHSLTPSAALFGEYHALIVHHSKQVCRKTQPLCGSCPLLAICPHGRRTVISETPGAV